jgi:dipeptidyl aminopeptidase/acylaminoacyl peptidase
MIRKSKSPVSILLCAGFMTLMAAAALGAQNKALTYQDIMRFRQIRTPVISADGRWVAYSAQPDRGDAQAFLHNLAENTSKHEIARGIRPVFSKDSAWAAFLVRPAALDLAKAGKDKPKQGLALVNLESGDIREIQRVQAVSFSENSHWLAVHLFKEDKKPEKAETAGKKSEEAAEAPAKPKVVGSTLTLINLTTGEEIQIPHVQEYGFDPESRFLAFFVAEPEGTENGLNTIRLEAEDWVRGILLQNEMALVSQLTWSKTGGRLAFIASTMPAGETPGDQDAALWIWDSESDKLFQVVAPTQAPQGWYLPEKNRLRWSRDGRRLFFGFKPLEFREQAEDPEPEVEEQGDLFDVEKILAGRQVDVWHWNDPFINTHQKNMWPRTKDQTYMAVYHADGGRIVPLADKDMPRVQPGENPDTALGFLDAPYRKMVTWYGQLSDLYVVDLKDGKRTKVVGELADRSSLSPGGRYVVYFQDKHWHLFDRRSQQTRNLTAEMDTPFYDEDHDYPQAVPSYGTAGWIEENRAVLIYDKYDIWKFPVRGDRPVNLTGGLGRREGYTFRVLQLDPDKEFFESGESLLLSAYHNHAKNWGFYAGGVDGREVSLLLEEQKKFRLLAKAEEADVLLYTRESYEEFPDLWVSDPVFRTQRKVSNVNPQIQDFAWGAAELVEWQSVDGIPLQGVLIKPGNYEPGKRYPVIVYYYRFFSQRVHEFNQTVINHRPHFPFYASNGYAVFLPDIRFQVGLPGFAATKCLVPGVQKLVDMGIADPDAIGLHGHSWSGYQTAFVVTQTDIFRCAVAGAPVSNMTSAYSGIRWGSGMARQFQYEQSQSRIGATLWERRDLYIDNSPVFFADRIQTPLLIIFGDEDGAVPWYQGIELYLAMRRLEKDCIFLQYRGEPHHPQKYPNKLDWFKKMKEYFDHYLKGEPGPEWITKGIPYRGK